MIIDPLEISLVGLVLFVATLIVFVGQGLFVAGNVRVEYSRKLIHIGLSAWVAWWLFLLPVNVVIVASMVLASGVFITKRFGLLKSIHGVRRSTHGEVTYALGITMTAILFPHPAVYALAILNLGFADGLAAVMGIRFGGKRRYDLWGRTESGKTLIGSFTAFSFTAFSGLIFWMIAPTLGAAWWLIAIHVLLSAYLVSSLEFVSRSGFDNIILPLAVALLYSPVVILG